MTGNLGWVPLAVFAISVGIVVAAWLAANRPQLSDRQALMLVALLLVVTMAAVVAVILPRQPAAAVAALALGWIVIRAVSPMVRTTGQPPRPGQVLLAAAASMAAAGAILAALQAKL